jgi:hypothetical protein
VSFSASCATGAATARTETVKAALPEPLSDKAKREAALGAALAAVPLGDRFGAISAIRVKISASLAISEETLCSSIVGSALQIPDVALFVRECAAAGRRGGGGEGGSVLSVESAAAAAARAPPTQGQAWKELQRLADKVEVVYENQPGPAAAGAPGRTG